MSTTRRPAAPLPEYRRAAHAKAVEARDSLAIVTGALRYNKPTTAADWHHLEAAATRGARWATDVASVARDAAAALEAGEA